MRKLTLILIAILALAALAGADDKADAVAAVHKFFDTFNKGDMKGAVATCSTQSAVTDEFSPYTWPSCAAWGNAYTAYAKKNGVTDGAVTMSDPTVAEVNGNRGYVVAPVSFSYKHEGKTVNEPGSTFAAALEKVGTTWKLKSWTWARGH